MEFNIFIDKEPGLTNTIPYSLVTYSIDIYSLDTYSIDTYSLDTYSLDGTLFSCHIITLANHENWRHLVI